jgi:N-acetylmuramoyl-L-alanine amidase
VAWLLGQITFFALPCLGTEKTNIKVLKTIVIDPGHGGKNHGVKGNNGTLEKNLTLTLAQMISSHLQNQYRVLLTRKNDRDMPLSDRTALANHHKADFFISIHAGAAFEPDVNGSFIMFYAPPKSKNLTMKSDMPAISNGQDSLPQQWEDLQLDYVSTSRKIAEQFRTELKKTASPLDLEVESANLCVLAGATMPALLFEPFYLTHPDSEKYYQNTKNLEQLAGDIAAGIAIALEKETP